MKKVGEKFKVEIDGYADISIEFSYGGGYKVIMPEYSIPAEKLCKVLRTIADNVEKIKDGSE